MKHTTKKTETKTNPLLNIENLSALVQRLIINTTNHDYLTLLQGQGNKLDLEYHSQHIFLPTGRTYCVMSGDANYEQDLIDLYNSTPKTIHKARTNFVFISNQTIENKTRVMNRLRHVRQWQSLVIIDQGDLNQWLDQAISAKVWAQEKINSNNNSIQTGAKWWTNWSTVTRDKQPLLLKPSLLFKHNTSMQKTRADLWQQIELNEYISVAWESCHLALAFVLATLQTNSRVYQNTIIIDDYDTYSKSWRLFNNNVIVILNFEHNNVEDILNGLEKTKAIIHICGKSDPVNRGGEVIIDVPDLYHKDITSWINDNLPKNHEFKEDILGSSHQYGCSLAILRHLCNNDLKSVKWLPHSEQEQKFMLTAMLAGQWKDEQGNRNNDYKDIEYIQQLLSDDYSYDDFINYLEPLQDLSDNPIDKTPSYMDSDIDNDNVWHITSANELWFLMQPHLDYKVWQDFKTVATEALSNPQISPYLKRGLLNSLIFYSMPEYQNGQDYQEQIAEIVNHILQADVLDLESDMLILGEIAPQEIIDFIDSDPEHFHKPTLLSLFWHPQYSKQVIEILLRSYKIDNEARLLNEMFQPFRLHTYTSYTQMLETLANHINDHELHDLIMQILLNQIPLTKTMEFKTNIPPQWQFKNYVRDVPNNIKVRQSDFIKIFELIAEHLQPDLHYYNGLFDALWAEFIPLNWKQFLFKTMQNKHLLRQFNNQQQLELYNSLRKRINAYYAKSNNEYNPDEQTIAEFQKFFDLIAPDDYRKDLWIFDAPSTEILNDETANSEDDRLQALNIIIPIFERMYNQCQSNLHDTLLKMPELTDLNIARLYKVINNSTAITQQEKDSLINDFDSDDKLLDALAGAMVKGNVYADLNQPNYEYLTKAYNAMDSEEKQLKLLFLMWVIDDGLVQFIADLPEHIQYSYWSGMPYKKLGDVSVLKTEQLLKHQFFDKVALWFARSENLNEVPLKLMYQLLKQYAPVFNDEERQIDEIDETNVNIAIVKIFNQIYNRSDIDYALMYELEPHYFKLSLIEYFDKVNKTETFGGQFPKLTTGQMSADPKIFMQYFLEYCNDLDAGDNRKNPKYYHLLHKWAGITNQKTQAIHHLAGHGTGQPMQIALTLDWLNQVWDMLPNDDPKILQELYTFLMNNISSYGMRLSSREEILPVWDAVINEKPLNDDIIKYLKNDLYNKIQNTLDANANTDAEKYNLEMIQQLDALSDNCPDGFSKELLTLIRQSYKEAAARKQEKAYEQERLKDEVQKLKDQVKRLQNR